MTQDSGSPGSPPDSIPKPGSTRPSRTASTAPYTGARRALRKFQDEVEGDHVQGKTGPEWHLEQTDQTPVITTKYGERIKPSSLSRWWSLERGNYGLDDFSLHEPRHTYLTLLAEEGVHPKVMQELAGHYGSQITMGVYAHVNMDAKREAVAAVSKLF